MLLDEYKLKKQDKIIKTLSVLVAVLLFIWYVKVNNIFKLITTISITRYNI